MWRSSARSRPLLLALASRFLEVERAVYHFWLARSDCGNRRARVRIVSSMRPSGNSGLGELALLCGVVDDNVLLELAF
jgi:hypothetical protein